MKRPLRNAFLVILILIGLTAATATFLIDRNISSTELVKVEDVSGIRFEVEDTSNDTFAKDEAVSVYAKRSVSDGMWFFPSWRNRRTLIFRYDPGRPDNPLPLITHPSQTTILISVPEVSSIIFQNQTWENISVSYEIGKVDYPAAMK